MNPQPLVAELLAIPDLSVQKQQITDSIAVLPVLEQDEAAHWLKTRADHFLRSDIQRCLATADLLLHLSTLNNNAWHRALGLRAKANAFCHGGLGQYRQAIVLYDEAAAIYQEKGHLVFQAGTQYAKITALASLGHYEEALKIGQWAAAVFADNQEWLLLAKLNVNLGSIYRRLGEDGRALALYDKACELYQQLQHEDAQAALARVEQNRIVVLRHLGRFDESITASQRALAMLRQSGQLMEAVRAQQNLAATYFVIGRYNEGLALLDEAREAFLADGRYRDAILIELISNDCLLQLRRFSHVLANCQRIRSRFNELGTRFEVAQSILNEAVAYAGLAHFEEALTALAEARQLFSAEGNDVWVASTDLETAVILQHQAQSQASFDKALACAATFARYKLPVEEAQAFVTAAQAALSLGQQATAQQLINTAMPVAQSQQLPTLAYQCYYLQATIARQQGDLPQARSHYDQARHQLEQLRGRLMIEFRADFLEDKQVIYEDLVEICLEMNEAESGLLYAERSKSRALLELLAFRLDLSLEARTEADEPLVAELILLRQERDRLYRRWEGGEVTRERGRITAMAEGQQMAQQDVLAIEKQITDLWHKLLIRNADYARDASLWQVHTESIQPYLDKDTAMLAYFIVKDKLLAFQITADSVEVQPLPLSLPQLQRLLQLMWLNLRSVPKSSPERIPLLTANILGILQQLHDCLIRPCAISLAGYKNLIIVPHGPLHYLPFHALYNGASYLLARHTISYLPSASFLSYGRTTATTNGTMAAFAHSYNGRLPHTHDEARLVAQRWRGRYWLEEESTLDQVKTAAQQCRILHLAAHADFRPDNPLFSGLALADGWLTTLDIFNLRVPASLVTLSACQTGRSVIGGGDELFGLMRAFLSAGAASLVLTLWPVEDGSTLSFMTMFYEALAQGCSKGEALRQAQSNFAEGLADVPDYFQHPYFWAPFYLVGDAGLL